jgi:hypothetical protein
VVLPDFYSTYQRIIDKNPEIVMIAGRVVVGDLELRWKDIVGILPPNGTDILANFVPLQLTKQNAQFCGTVVRRQAYEAVGGIYPFPYYAADRDMWLRIALLGPVAGTHHPYAIYRQHSESDWHRLFQSGTVFKDMYSYAQLSRERLARAGQPVPPYDYQALAREALWHAAIQDDLGEFQRRFEHAAFAWHFAPNLHNLWYMVKSWLKVCLKGARAQEQVAATLAAGPSSLSSR